MPAALGAFSDSTAKSDVVDRRVVRKFWDWKSIGSAAVLFFDIHNALLVRR
jgi:hypothetical protein